MKSLGILFSILLLFLLIWHGPSEAQSSFTLEDIRGESPLCTQVLDQENLGPVCHSEDSGGVNTLNKDIAGIDIHLATDEIKREIVTMAESQVTLSLGLLQKLGITTEHADLGESLKKLQKNGVTTIRSKQKINSHLLDKYLVASLRYYDLKRRKEHYGVSELEQKKIQERIQLMEIRYPLVTQHNFTRLKDFVMPKIKEGRTFTREEGEESRILDNYLFNDTPEKVAEIDTSGLNSKSLGISALRGFKQASEEIKDEIRSHLKDDLQKSLASQLNALTKIEGFGECELLTLHSQSSQRAINSSAAPDQVFKKLCECRKKAGPVSDTAIMGMGVASLGGLLLCITPTGIGQLIGCPTAAVAGWGATGASAINFADSLGKYNDLNTQDAVMTALPKSEINQKELELIRGNKSELAKSLSTEQLTGLIGFGVGHVGVSGLAKIYKNSQITLSLNKLSKYEKDQLEEVLVKLNPEEQTQIFVVLDKLDGDSREVLLARPALLFKEFKQGGRCEL